MEIQTVIEQLREARTMDAAARQLGRDFASHETGDLRELQREVVALAAGLDERESAEVAAYRRGFLRALEMMAAGYEGQRIKATRDRADLAVIRSRRHWCDVLSAIKEGRHTQKEIHESTAIPTSTLSKVVTAMTNAKLVARRRREGAEDLRLHPLELTARGADACGRLFTDLHAPLEDTVEAAVAGVTAIIERGRAPLSAIQHEFRHLGEVRAVRATEIVTRVLSARCLAIVDRSRSVVANVHEVDRDLLRAFEDALRTRTDLGARAFELAERDALAARDLPDIVKQWMALSAGDKLIVRTSGRFNHWEIIQKTFGPVNLEIIRESMPLPPAPDERTPFRMLWENAAVLQRDKERHGPWLDSIMSRARALNIYGEGAEQAMVDHPIKSHRPGMLAPGGESCRN